MTYRINDVVVIQSEHPAGTDTYVKGHLGTIIDITEEPGETIYHVEIWKMGAYAFHEDEFRHATGKEILMNEPTISFIGPFDEVEIKINGRVINPESYKKVFISSGAIIEIDHSTRDCSDWAIEDGESKTWCSREVIKLEVPANATGDGFLYMSTENDHDRIRLDCSGGWAPFIIPRI